MSLIRIGDSYIELLFVDPAKTWRDNSYGELDEDERRIVPVILISKDLSGVTLLDTLIHEITHLLMPYLKEDSVSDFANNLSQALHELGYQTNEQALLQRPNNANSYQTGNYQGNAARSRNNRRAKNDNPIVAKGKGPRTTSRSVKKTPKK